MLTDVTLKRRNVGLAVATLALMAFAVSSGCRSNTDDLTSKPTSNGSTLNTISNVTYEELKKAQEETGKLLDELGISFASDINRKENQVELYVTDNELFNSTLRAAGKNLPPHVVAIVIYEPLREVPFPVNPDPLVHFPQLKVRSGLFMEALTVGELTLKEGYLRVGDNLIIWQPDYFVNSNNGTIEILDRDGKVVGRVGDEIVMGGGIAGTVVNINRSLKEPLPLDTQGPCWIQGSGTRLSLNFSSNLFSLETITFGEDKAYFLKRKPPLDDLAKQEITLAGKMVASYNGVLIKYPFIVVGAKPEENKGPVSYATFWPSEYTARINNGEFEVLDGAGKVVLRDGEDVDISGKVIYAYSAQLNEELPGGHIGPYLMIDRIVK